MRSSLATIVNLSPNFNPRGSRRVTRITPHFVVGQLPAQTVANMPKFKDAHIASANYIIGKDGEILCNVEEENRAWTSDSRSNDYSAITIECASDLEPPYTFNDKVRKSLVDLLIDICSRYNKCGIVIANNEEQAQLMEAGYQHFFVITYHRFFAKVECPGQWLVDNMPLIAEEVNKALTDNTWYKVQVGAFKEKSNAERLRDKLRDEGYDDAFIVETIN